jgi:hypothetical protein
MTPDGLKDHAFTKAVFDAVRPVLKVEYDYRQRQGRDAEYVPNEYEFYLMRVGNRLAAVLSHCEQLSHAILFMSNYRQTAAMGRTGITRMKHLRYNIESYIIRTQTLYDLVLKLIDAVFHLLNSDSQCRHATIVQNLKVKQTEIPNVLKPLRKKLSEFEQARHIVIHRGTYQDDELYRLELFTELEDSYRKSGHDLPVDIAFVPEARVEMTRELIKKRKAQYARFNSRVLQLVSDVFAVLHERFEEEERRLRILTERGAQPGAAADS